MTDDLDRALSARFASQDDPGLRPPATFELVRSHAAQLERHSRRRRQLAILVAAVVAALVALPAIALSRTLVERWFGTAASPGLRNYIGRVLHVRPGASFTTPPRYVAGLRTTRGLVLLWAGRRNDGTQCAGIEAAFGDPDIIRMQLAGRTIADNGMNCGVAPIPLSPTNAGLTNGQASAACTSNTDRCPPACTRCA